MLNQINYQKPTGEITVGQTPNISKSLGTVGQVVLCTAWSAEKLDLFSGPSGKKDNFISNFVQTLHKNIIVVRTLHLRVKNSSEQDELETFNMFAALLIAKMNFSTFKNVDKNVKEKFDIFV